MSSNLSPLKEKKRTERERDQPHPHTYINLINGDIYHLIFNLENGYKNKSFWKEEEEELGCLL